MAGHVVHHPVAGAARVRPPARGAPCGPPLGRQHGGLPLRRPPRRRGRDAPPKHRTHPVLPILHVRWHPTLRDPPPRPTKEPSLHIRVRPRALRHGLPHVVELARDQLADLRGNRPDKAAHDRVLGRPDDREVARVRSCTTRRDFGAKVVWLQLEFNFE